jgi:hypothetical protein
MFTPAVLNPGRSETSAAASAKAAKSIFFMTSISLEWWGVSSMTALVAKRSLIVLQVDPSGAEPGQERDESGGERKGG